MVIFRCLKFKLIVIKCDWYCILKGINHKLCITDYNIFRKLITGPAWPLKIIGLLGICPLVIFSARLDFEHGTYIYTKKHEQKMRSCLLDSDIVADPGVELRHQDSYSRTKQVEWWGSPRR